MADKYYLANRLKYHTASRIANQTGDSLAASFNVDGHIVRTSSVWANGIKDFPLQSNKKNADPVGATDDLVTVFKNGATSEAFWNGGLVWTNPNYPAVKLYENVTLTPVAASLGQNMNSGTPSGTARYQAYEILAAADGISEGTLRLTEWVAPPAIIDPETGSPVAGYSGKQMLDGTPLQAKDDANWSLGGGHWEFVYIAGILTFEMGYTPQEINNKSTAGLTLTAFKFTGEYLDASISGIDKKIEDAVKDLNTNIANAKEIADVDVTLATAEQTTWNIRGFDGQMGPDGVPIPSKYSIDGMYACVWVVRDNKTSNITPADVVKIHSINTIGTAPVPVFGPNYAGYYFWSTPPVTYNTPNVNDKPITSTIADGVVTVTIAAEVLAVKQGTETISPDMSYTGGVTTLTADYGTATIPETWTLTYRI